MLHQATVKLIILLREKLNDKEECDINLTPMLLKRVWRAALKCPGFSPSQKDDIVIVAGLDGRTAVDHGVPPYAAEWKYLFTIGPKAGVPFDLVYVSLHSIKEFRNSKIF
jgi:hypothetical protein